MRCAFSSITCPAAGPPSRTGGDIACVVRAPAATRVLIGDVMGHGAPAEAIADGIRKAFRLLARHEDPPQVIAMRMDQVVQGVEGREQFMTAQIISVPRARGAEAEIVNCGHPPPLLLRGGGATYLDAIPPVPPLGLLDLTTARGAQASLLGARPGDGLLLYTDGVTDARDGQGIPYPLDERAAAIAAQVRGAAQPPNSAFVKALRADLLRHAGEELRDDATLMYVELADEPGPEPRSELWANRAATPGNLCIMRGGNMNIQYS